jgi:hypothetical protein
MIRTLALLAALLLTTDLPPKSGPDYGLMGAPLFAP